MPGAARFSASSPAAAKRSPRFQQAHPQHPISLYPVDVRDADALAAAAAQFIAQYGCPDIVIANAGISRGAVTGHGDLRNVPRT